MQTTLATCVYVLDIEWQRRITAALHPYSLSTHVCKYQRSTSTFRSYSTEFRFGPDQITLFREHSTLFTLLRLFKLLSAYWVSASEKPVMINWHVTDLALLSHTFLLSYVFCNDSVSPWVTEVKQWELEIWWQNRTPRSIPSRHIGLRSA